MLVRNSGLNWPKLVRTNTYAGKKDYAQDGGQKTEMIVVGSIGDGLRESIISFIEEVARYKRRVTEASGAH